MSVKQKRVSLSAEERLRLFHAIEWLPNESTLEWRGVSIARRPAGWFSTIGGGCKYSRSVASATRRAIWFANRTAK